MSWTNDEDKSRIKKVSDQLAEELPAPKGPGSSVRQIQEYHFATPEELSAQLDSIWDELGKPQMKKFTIPTCIAAFNQRDFVDEREEEVSPFNYEF